MKKFVLLLLCLGLSLSVLSGCSGSAEPFERKNFEAEAEQVEKLVIDVRDRVIDLAPSEDGKLHIDYFENSQEYYDIFISDDRTLSMKAMAAKDWKDYVGTKAAEDSRRISLRLPEDLLEALELSTTNEDITISPLSVAGDISLASNGGNIYFEALNAGSSISLWVKNGDISGSVVGGYDDYAINCEIKKGDSDLPAVKEGGDKSLNVQANNGDIDIRFVEG